MKKIGIIFTALAFTAGIAVISCTKQSTETPQAVALTQDAILVDNSASEITGIIDDYQAINATAFADPTLKSAVADGPNTMSGTSKDNCATVTMVKTPVIAGGVVTGATVIFTIDFGTIACKNKDGKVRKGKIVNTFTWVKEGGGWSRVSVIDIYVDDIHHVGTESSTYSKIVPFGHAYYTEVSSLTITAKDGTSKSWASERQRELIEGNGISNPVKIYKITGNSTFTNSKGLKSTYVITNALYTSKLCKGYVAGTITTTSTAGVVTTVDYGLFTTPAAITCKDGYTVKAPGDKDGKGIINTFIKFGK